MKKESFYIGAPIYYVNDRPHVGHAYTTIAADTIARYERLRGKEVQFVTGTDENSQKTVDAATKKGEDIVAYTDRLAELWKFVWQELNISNTDFVRTTEIRHVQTAHELWKRIAQTDDIYKGIYQGLYCVGHEAFMKESELMNGLCPDHKTKPEHIEEENYFFRLSKYQNKLLDLYAKRSEFVVPASRYNEVKRFVESGLEDISISRETRTWGIPVLENPKHVMYVWFEALMYYISAVGIKGWEEHPIDVHMVGKDIVRFHAIIWPAMLMSAGLPLPKQVVANGFFTVDGLKISKSLGNAIDPLILTAQYGVDALRYYLLREIPYGEDGDFSEAKLAERYNADLANGLGNFAARVLALAVSQTPIDRDEFKPELRVEAEIALAEATRAGALENFLFHEAVAGIWKLISFGDQYVNETKPWENKAGSREVIINLLAMLDNVASLLVPFLPATSEKITAAFVWKNGKLTVKKIEPLFPRLP